MYSNHGNLYNKLLDLVLGQYGVFHAKVNGTDYGVGGGRIGLGTGTYTEGAGKCRQKRTGNGEM